MKNHVFVLGFKMMIFELDGTEKQWGTYTISDISESYVRRGCYAPCDMIGS